MRPSAIVAEAYASGKIKLFEFLIDVTRIPVILQENYGFGYILQKMNFTFQYGEIHILAQLVAHFTRNDFTFQYGEIYTRKNWLFNALRGLYIPIWRDSYFSTLYFLSAFTCFTFQHGEIQMLLTL